MSIMSCSRNVLLFGAVIIGAAGIADAAESLPATRDLPAAIAADIGGIVRIDNYRWVDETAMSFSAALGKGGDVVSEWIAESLTNLSSFRGIDPARPGLIAWRSGAAPMIAVIPVSDRTRFLGDFGQLYHIDRLMIQIGEREGAHVFRQVTVDGNQEYCVFLRDDYAYVARTIEECRAMAEQPLRVNSERPALYSEWRGSFLADTISDITEQYMLGSRAAVLDAMRFDAVMAATALEWRSALAQVRVLRWWCGPHGAAEQDLSFGLDADAQSGTALAAWLVRQSNGASRLLPMVMTDDELLHMHGAFRWQGELESGGRAATERLQGLTGRVVQVETEQEVRGYFNLRDRQGPFALSLSLDVGKQVGDAPAPIHYRLNSVSEQPRATDLLSKMRGYDLALRHDKHWNVQDFTLVDDLASYSVASDAHQVVKVADHSRLVQACAATAEASLSAARSIVAALAENHQPIGEAGIFSVMIRFDRLFSVLSQRRGGDPIGVPEVSATFTVRKDDQQRFAGSAVIPLEELREAIVRSGFLLTGSE